MAGTGVIRIGLSAMVADLPARKRAPARRKIARFIVDMLREEDVEAVPPELLRAAGITEPGFPLLGRLEELVALLPDGEEKALEAIHLLFDLADRDGGGGGHTWPELETWLEQHVRAWYATRGER